MPPGLALYAYSAFGRIGKDAEGAPLLSECSLYCKDRGHGWAMRRYLDRLWLVIADERARAKRVLFERARGGDGG